MSKQFIQDLKARAKKKSRAMAIESLSSNEIAEQIAPSFLKSREWRQLRLTVLEKYGAKCMRCGSLKEINVDHVKPRLFFPELALVFDNLQVLCQPCNKWKGNLHYNDYRSTADLSPLLPL